MNKAPGEVYFGTLREQLEEVTRIIEDTLGTDFEVAIHGDAVDAIQKQQERIALLRQIGDRLREQEQHSGRRVQGIGAFSGGANPPLSSAECYAIADLFERPTADIDRACSAVSGVVDRLSSVVQGISGILAGGAEADERRYAGLNALFTQTHNDLAVRLAGVEALVMTQVQDLQRTVNEGRSEYAGLRERAAALEVQLQRSAARARHEGHALWQSMGLHHLEQCSILVNGKQEQVALEDFLQQYIDPVTAEAMRDEAVLQRLRGFYMAMPFVSQPDPEEALRGMADGTEFVGYFFGITTRSHPTDSKQRPFNIFVDDSSPQYVLSLSQAVGQPVFGYDKPESPHKALGEFNYARSNIDQQDARFHLLTQGVGGKRSTDRLLQQNIGPQVITRSEMLHYATIVYHETHRPAECPGIYTFVLVSNAKPKIDKGAITTDALRIAL